MTPETQKFTAAVLLFGAWLVLVLVGKTPVEPFVQFVELAIIGIGVVHYNGAPKP
jgi:hypothetical protein